MHSTAPVEAEVIYQLLVCDCKCALNPDDALAALKTDTSTDPTEPRSDVHAYLELTQIDNLPNIGTRDSRCQKAYQG